jgi:drug/metabolite transporter (DMT)-like permease
MQRPDRTGLACAALGIAAVGAGVAVSSHLTRYPILSAQAARYGLAALILALIARRRRRPEPRGTLRDWIRIVLVAATGMALFNVAVVRAVTSGEPAVVATIIGCAPIVFALAVPALERRRPTMLVVGGACLVAGGAAVVEGFGTADTASLAWSAVALACEVAFTVIAAPVLRTISPLALSLRACAVAAVLLACASAALDGTGALAIPDRTELLAMGYLALVSTVIAFLLWYSAVRRLGAETAGLLSGLMPVSAAVVGAAVTPAPFRWQTLAGAFLVAAGLLLALARSRRAAIRPPAGRPLTHAPAAGAPLRSRPEPTRAERYGGQEGEVADRPRTRSVSLHDAS